MSDRFQLHSTTGGSTLFDAQSGECFKSRHHVALEVEEVFLRPGLWERIAEPNRATRVLELGFGLGTIFRQWAKWAEDQDSVHSFETIERDCSGAQAFLSLEPHEPVEALLRDGQWRGEKAAARLWRGSFEEVLPRLSKENSATFDAVFFDPFSPKSNPESWSLSLFQLCHQLLKPGGRLVTYSVSKQAKENAALAGFLVSKKQLPKELGKKESLVATKIGGQA